MLARSENVCAARTAGDVRRASSVVQKAVVAGAGLILAGWSCLHLFGTLTAFGGPALMDPYAAWLRRGGGLPLWGMRVVLLGAFGVHVWLVLRLWAAARRARPVGYAVAPPRAATLAAKLVRWGGLGLLLLLAAHVLQVTLGVGHPGLRPGEAYANLMAALRSGASVLVHLGLAALFALHLGHGLYAAGVSLGARIAPRLCRRASLVLAAAVGAGFAAVPVAAWWGVLR